MRLSDDYRRMPSLAGWDGPEDDPRDDDLRIFTCCCGITYAPGCWWTAHDFVNCGRNR